MGGRHGRRGQQGPGDQRQQDHGRIVRRTAGVLANAGLEPAYRRLLTLRVRGASVPEAPSRVGTSTAGADALYVTFNPPSRTAVRR